MGDFPHSPGAKTPSPQCRGPRFDPWSGNWIPLGTARGSRAAARDPMRERGPVQPQKQINIFLKEGLETAGLVVPGWHVALFIERQPHVALFIERQAHAFMVIAATIYSSLHHALPPVMSSDPSTLAPTQGHSQRLTVPLVPVTGHGHMVEALTHLLHDLVLGVHVSIHREAPLEQTLGLLVDGMGDEPLGPVLRQGTCHPHLSRLVHQGPGHRGPLKPQQAEVGETPDTTLDEPQAPLVAAKKPESVHHSRMAKIRR